MYSSISVMKSIFSLALVASLFLSCNSKDIEKANGTYLSGEIINPVHSYLLLYQNETVTDSIPLDNNNRFSYKFDNVNEGLYRVVHGEFQIVHIEKGDSILMRVNTKEFDESLTFSGYGASKNNFLINKFLHFEEENKFLKIGYQKNPTNFEKLLDSMETVHTKELTSFLSKDNYSENFKEIAAAATTIDNCHRKESYPFARYTKDKYTFIKSFPEDFYSFRKNINLNNNNLQELLSYRRYLNMLTNHLAFMKYGDKQYYDRTSYIHNHHKVIVIDSLIKNDLQKDRLLKQVARLFIANSNNLKDVENLFKEIKEVATSQETIAILDTSYKSNIRMQAGNKVPEILLTNQNGESEILLNTINKPTVLYFWTYSRLPHMTNIHKRAAELQKKYPEFDFVGINRNTEQKEWLRHINKNNYTSEYQFTKPEHAIESLVITDQNKTIVLDKNGVILNSHANLHNSDFENDLLAYLNL